MTSVIKTVFRYICILFLLKSVLQIFRLTSKNTDFSYNFGLGFADWSEQSVLKDLQNNVTILSKDQDRKGNELMPEKNKDEKKFFSSVASIFHKYWETLKKYFKITFVK